MNEITLYKNFDDMRAAANALMRSGYFADVKSETQALVKVMAGMELGLPPFASMSGIHIIQGKPTLGANVIATLVKNDPRYNYKVKQADATACVLEWFEDGKKVGEAGFTIQEAQAAGLTGKGTWKAYPSDMLFARAISRGARRFAPGIFGGSPVYTPEEMGADTDEEGFIIDVQPTAEPIEYAEYIEEETPIQKAKPTIRAKPERPYTPMEVKRALERTAETMYPASDKQTQFLASKLGEFVYGDTNLRHQMQAFLFGSSSLKDVDRTLVMAGLKWLDLGDTDNDIDKMAQKELAEIRDMVQTQIMGQQRMDEILDHVRIEED